MTLKTSLVITGDSSGAVAEVNALRGSIAAVGPAADNATTRSKALDNALTGLARSGGEVDTAFAKTIASSSSLNGYLDQVKGAQQRFAAEQRAAMETTGLQRAGYAQLGAQLQDITSQMSTGTSLFTILAQQGGQLAAAIAMIAPQAQQGRERHGKAGGRRG